ncbi:preprotein translocase subunit SecE [Bartonella bovis]|uniref:Protein translocase subunit SecE n=1 Tax=Bartonella bovis 91-4 TaxID=1094491 RepID=N6VG47_9HYPH|nr:preprotein translocase subunit SecE [Bartonella bovis]ENN92216.1 preprotein translocase subunit SecE [Bartonella bovis 91-4]
MASRTNPITFFKQVLAETAKVKWPTRRETVVSTIMVLVLAAFASILFFIVDQIINFGVWQGIDLLKYLFGR